jgi:photosystem II stability/assembly factor-like uncharacterized protein
VKKLILFAAFLAFLLIIGCGDDGTGPAKFNDDPGNNDSIRTGKWNEMPIEGGPVSGVLYSVHFVDSSNGWAVGCNEIYPHNTGKGLILHYSDGVWRNQEVPELWGGWALKDVFAISPNEAWAVGAGFILKYSGGVWTRVIEPEQASELDGIYFSSPDEGWTVGKKETKSGYLGIIFHYVNGNWSVVDFPPQEWAWRLHDVHFPVANEGWAVGMNINPRQGKILHYKQGEWNEMPVPTLNDNWDLRSVFMLSTSIGWALTGYVPGVLLKCSNGKWSEADPTPSSLIGTSDVWFLNEKEGWIAGWLDDVLFHYANGSWKSVTPEGGISGVNLFGLHFFDRKNGWAVGSRDNRSVIYRYRLIEE